MSMTLSCAALVENKGEYTKTYSLSLTGSNYTGKKFYLGWGHAAPNDPSMMKNETKYDVLKTHDIFTKDIGGSYEGKKLIEQRGSTEAIKESFSEIAQKTTSNDMYVQYSSGHGFPQGLQYGGSYTDIANRILSLNSKEMISFTMACYSGGLVNEFNRRKAEWSNYKEQGRTLFVMASSTVQQTSSTGPGMDQENPDNPYGSAGSAFGHALYRALKGEADGYVDGVKDGFVDLGEIESYTKSLTKRIGGHTPVATGVYNPGLIMNKVLSAEDIAGMEFADRGTDRYDEYAMQQIIKSEDTYWSQNLSELPKWSDVSN